jgi:CubicO group peptidase (beta-lactamase class C family)
MCTNYETAKQVLDGIVAPSITARENIGLAVGVIKHGQHQIFGYGTLTNAHMDPIDGSTLFEIGSVTKVFTSALLVSATGDGLVGLDDRLCDLLPELSNFPRDITLRQLATHTSGLPRLPSNLTRSWLRNPENPYEAYTTADLLAYLAGYKPKRARKSGSAHAFRYSNLGFGLLGHVLAQRIGTSYEETVVSRICNPLGMGDTRVNLSPEQRERLATPHTARGRPTQHWDLPTLAGAGALHSTTCDMLKFIAANLGNTRESVEKVLHTCHTGDIEIPHLAPHGIHGLVARWRKSWLRHLKPPVNMALGWLVSRLAPSGHKVYWHNGATGGYRAFVGFVKESSTGIVVLSNGGLSQYDLFSRVLSVEEIGFRLLKFVQEGSSIRS